jgi:hypothetical protein
VDNTTGVVWSPHRSWRGYHHQLGDQVHRRAWELHRRHHRRLGQLQVGQRQVPRVHRARPELPRPGLLGTPSGDFPGWGTWPWRSRSGYSC